MELRANSIACSLVVVLACALGPAPALAAEEFPALERHYSVDPARNQRPPRERWSTVVQHPRHTFLAWGHRTTSEANAAALAQCERQMGADAHQCRVVVSFTRCAAQAGAFHDERTAIGEGSSLAEAEAAATESCHQQSGDACSLRWSYCGDGSGQVFSDQRQWGAVARPLDGGGQAILVKNLKEQSTALIEANWHCEQVNKRPCESLFHFAQCAAYAESRDQDFFGWSRGAVAAEAEQEAEASCSRSAGSLCEVKLSHCH